MKSWNPDQILRILAEAGAIAMGHYDRPMAELKSDRSIVTQADHDIEALFETQFQDAENGSYLIGEETILGHEESYIRDALNQTAWIVDPIDGTSAYAHHVATWGISIGFAQAGSILEGAVYLPVTQELFITRGSGIYFAEGMHPGHDGALPELREISPVATPIGEDGMIAITQVIAKGGGMSVVNPVQALGCAVLPMTYMLLGRFAAYLGRVKLWDIAGALPMLLRAGFVARMPDGTTLDAGITDANYNLTPGDPDRWKLRLPIVCAATEANAQYVVEAATGYTGV